MYRREIRRVQSFINAGKLDKQSRTAISFLFLLSDYKIPFLDVTPVNAQNIRAEPHYSFWKRDKDFGDVLWNTKSMVHLTAHQTRYSLKKTSFFDTSHHQHKCDIYFEEIAVNELDMFS